MKDEEILEENYSPIHTRFAATPWYKDRPDITLIGAGNIGSWLGVVLLKCGYNINLYEFDNLETVNVGPQLYPNIAEGETISKVQGMQEAAKVFSDTEVKDMGKFEEDSVVTPLMVIAVDNMATRKLIFEKWKKQSNRVAIVDGRTFRDSMQVFAVTKKNEDVYEKEHLFADSEVEDANCADKSYPYVGSLIAGLMASVITNIYSNLNLKVKVKRIPFFQTFDITLMKHERLTV